MKEGLMAVGMLIVSNIFMTVAWYGHLKLHSAGISKNWPLFVVILASWGMAFLEYCFMVPANRIGFRDNGGPFSLFQLKVIQEAVSLSVFTIIAVWAFQGERLHWNHVCAFICLMAAVGFAFYKA